MAPTQVTACWPSPGRSLQDAPRQRPQQGALARAGLHRLRGEPYVLERTSEDHDLVLTA